MQLPFLLSLLLHIIILLFMFFGLDVSYQNPIVEENTLVVDFAQLGPKTAAPIKLEVPEGEQKQKKTPQKEIKEPVEKKEKTDTATLESDRQKSREKVDQPTEKTPKPKEEKDSVNLKKPTKEKQKVEKKKEEIKKKKNASKQRAQMNLDAKHDKSQKGKKSSLDDMLDDLMDDKAKDSKTSHAGAPETAELFTASEISILRAHISRCWNVHSGAMGAKHHVVDVEIHLSKDGFVQSAQVVDKARMKSDPYYRVSAETAQRSLLDDECNPLPIPASSYDKWKVITFRFDPKDMF
ncbi:MAG TPA: hypothetical protein DIC42_04015 [Holosporales bacterium]|nr:hypothetical protein [Holosporales bacterium]